MYIRGLAETSVMAYVGDIGIGTGKHHSMDITMETPAFKECIIQAADAGLKSGVAGKSVSGTIETLHADEHQILILWMNGQCDCKSSK